MNLPFKHQVTGTKWLVERPFGFLADDMGLGKTRQVIDAVEVLHAQGKVNQVIVVTPAPGRGVWCDPELGQLAEYLTVDSTVTEYCTGKARSFTVGDAPDPGGTHLRWIVTNYELIRRAERLKALLSIADEQTVLVLDESLYVKSHKAKQARAAAKLRAACGRVYLLNGTPEGDNPGDAFTQYQIMSRSILDCKTVWQYRARYAIMNPRSIPGHKTFKEIVGWTNLDDLARRTSPHTLRRTKDECLDLPPKIPPVSIEVPLGKGQWELYCQMRDDAVAWLSANRTASAAQSGVRVLRLAQLTAGFLGGVNEHTVDGDELATGKVEIIGDEKLDAAYDWATEAFRRGEKAILWCRFRIEAERLYERLAGVVAVGLLWGNQKKEDRRAAEALLNPRTAPDGPAAVVGTTRTGSFALDLQAANNVLYVSNDYSLIIRRQSEDRAHRIGQIRPVGYFDLEATGPKGQKTVDHQVVKALRHKANVARWTAGDWAKALEEE